MPCEDKGEGGATKGRKFRTFFLATKGDFWKSMRKEVEKGLWMMRRLDLLESCRWEQGSASPVWPTEDSQSKLEGKKGEVGGGGESGT